MGFARPPFLRRGSPSGTRGLFRCPFDRSGVVKTQAPQLAGSSLYGHRQRPPFCPARDRALTEGYVYKSTVANLFYSPLASSRALLPLFPARRTATRIY